MLKEGRLGRPVTASEKHTSRLRFLLEGPWPCTSFVSCSCLRIHSAFASWIHSYFDNVMTKFMINNRIDSLKTDVNLLSRNAAIGWLCEHTWLPFVFCQVLCWFNPQNSKEKHTTTNFAKFPNHFSQFTKAYLYFFYGTASFLTAPRVINE